jgi:4-amino-4-deoxy-L-arabinose transferase-like glycosyltransferase
MDQRGLWRGLVVVTVIAAVALRVWVLAGPIGATDSDEAVVGLIGRHALDGEFRTFFWGQSYGGTPAVAITAVLFALLGSSVLTLKLAPLLATAATLVLMWRVGVRTFGARAALLATLMFAVWPGAYVWWSTKERLFYWPGLALGLVILLTALRVAERPNRWLDWAVMGLATGLGWWATPQIVFFAFPAVVWLIVRDRRMLLRLPMAGVTALIGAAPWLRVNLRQDFISLQIPPQPSSDGYLDHLQHLVARGIPTALGLRVAYTGRWLLGAVAVVAYVVLLVVLFRSMARRPRSGSLVALVVVLFPFIYAISPYTWFVGEGRYVLFLAPFLALLLAHALSDAPVGVGAAAVAACLIVSVAGLLEMRGVTEPFAGNVHVPRRIDPVVRTLERERVSRVFANYWIAYRLSFETDEHVIATPSTGARRYQPYEAAVRGARAPAWVFVDGQVSIRHFVAEMRRIAVPYRRVETRDFVVFLPARRVVPEDIVADALP